MRAEREKVKEFNWLTENLEFLSTTAFEGYRKSGRGLVTISKSVLDSSEYFLGYLPFAIVERFQYEIARNHVQSYYPVDEFVFAFWDSRDAMLSRCLKLKIE